MAGDNVTLTIDGKEITVPKGTKVIAAAEELGIHIPHFCYHAGLPIDGNWPHVHRRRAHLEPPRREAPARASASGHLLDGL